MTNARHTPSQSRVSVGAMFLVLLGAILVTLALLSSRASIERAIFGVSDGRLEWGPDLFRALLALHGVVIMAWALAMTYRRAACESFVPDAAGLPQTSSHAPWGPWFVLALLITAALPLRLWQLNSCLWLDEVFTLVDFLRLPLREIVAVFPSQNQHMLYSVLGRLSIFMFGESAAAARMPAVLFGVAGIWALFLLGRRTNGVREALLACTIMTFSYHHIWFSQNARGYSGLLFFTIFVSWLWMRAVESGGGRWWIAYAVSVALGLWVHMTMIFVVGAHGLTWLTMVAARSDTRRRVARRTLDPGFAWKALLAWAFAATGALQLHALALPEFLRSALHEESRDSAWTDPWWVVRETVQRLADGGLGSVAVLVGVAVMVAGLVSLMRRDWHVGGLMALPAILGGGTMLVMGHNLWPRFFFFCMGFFLLFAVRGASVVSSWVLLPFARPEARRRFATWAGSLACLMVVAASAYAVPRKCYSLPKQDFTGARAFVERERQPSDAVVAVGLAAAAYDRYFAPEWLDAANVEELDAICGRYPRVWLVYTLPIQLEAWSPDIWKAVQRDFRLIREFPGTLGGGEILVCRWPADAGHSELRRADAD